MVSESKRTMELLRERDRQKRSLQLWVGLLVVWGVVLGWVVFFALRSIAPDMSAAVAWLIYLVPLAVLAIIAFMQVRRGRAIDADLLSSTEADRQRG